MGFVVDKVVPKEVRICPGVVVFPCLSHFACARCSCAYCQVDEQANFITVAPYLKK
jgi:hypothetical protein